MKTLSRILNRLFARPTVPATPAPTEVKKPLPDWMQRHFEAQDAGHFTH
jgi:hypothetical protein